MWPLEYNYRNKVNIQLGDYYLKARNALGYTLHN